METSRGVRWGVVIPIVLVVGVLVCFSPAFNGELLIWDDQANFVENVAWRGLGAANLKWMATTLYMGHYQPLTWLSFAVQNALGLGGPGAMHTVNVLLHAVNAVLFFFLCRALLRAGMGGEERELSLAAGLAAGLFAWHPLRAESVAWVTERRDVLSTALLLGSALAYVRAAEVGRAALKDRRWYWWSVGLLGLSCLSKAWGMGFFLVLLALDWWPLRRLSRDEREGTTMKTWSWHVVLEKWPMVVIGAASAVIAAKAQEATFAIKTLAQWPLADRIVQACYGLWFYVRETFAPSGLSPLYQLPARMEPTAYLFSIVFALAVAGLIVWCWKRRPAVSVALLAYVILVAPVLGLFQSGEQVVADRYSYVATMPLAVLLAAGVVLVVRRSAAGGSKMGGLAGALAGIVLASLGLLTYSQAAVWRTSLALWEHAAAVTPSPMVLVYYGDTLLRGGRTQDAYEAYTRALTEDPKNGRAQFSCAIILEHEGKIQEAEKAFLEAIPNLDTRRYQAYGELGVIYWNQGRREEALKQFELAMADVQRPGHKRPSGRPFIMMAKARHDMGDDAAAAAMLSKAMEYPDTREEAEAALRGMGGSK